MKEIENIEPKEISLIRESWKRAFSNGFSQKEKNEDKWRT